ncbi:MAG: hypothetical protein ACI8ZB_003821 [Desulforhopalus sp.]
MSKEYAEAMVNDPDQSKLSDFMAKLKDGSISDRIINSFMRGRFTPQLICHFKDNPDELEDFIITCRNVRSFSADSMVIDVFSKIEGADHLLHQYLIDAVDDERAVDDNMPAFHAIISLFELNVPAQSGSYEITQRAHNDIKGELFTRAKGTGNVANGCKHLLAHVELERREYGRPIDEIRHPAPEENNPWDEILINDVAH